VARVKGRKTLIVEGRKKNENFCSGRGETKYVPCQKMHHYREGEREDHDCIETIRRPSHPEGMITFRQRRLLGMGKREGGDIRRKEGKGESPDPLRGRSLHFIQIGDRDLPYKHLFSSTLRQKKGV